MYIKQVGPGILRARGPREAGWVGAGPGRGGGGERLPGGPRVGLGSGCSRGFPWGAAAACQGLVGRRGPRARGGAMAGGPRPSAGMAVPRAPRWRGGLGARARPKAASRHLTFAGCRRAGRTLIAECVAPLVCARLFTSVKRVFPRRRAPQGELCTQAWLRFCAGPVRP